MNNSIDGVNVGAWADTTASSHGSSFLQEMTASMWPRLNINDERRHTKKPQFLGCSAACHFAPVLLLVCAAPNTCYLRLQDHKSISLHTLWTQQKNTYSAGQCALESTSLELVTCLCHCTLRLGAAKYACGDKVWTIKKGQPCCPLFTQHWWEMDEK